MKRYVVAYSYETPFLLSSGDHVRIKSIHDFTRKECRCTTLFYCLGNESSLRKEQGRIYVERPRLFNRTIKRIVHWTNNPSLEENLTKIMQLVLDEPFLILQTSKTLKHANVVFVHGSMTVAPLVLRLLGFRGTVLYDSLANYSQTLYIRVHKGALLERILGYLRLGVYLAIYRLQLRSSNKVLYPSLFDANNASAMFGLSDKTVVIPNIFISSYMTCSDLQRLRSKYRKKLNVNGNAVILVFCAGFRSRANREAMDFLVQLDKEDLSDNHKLLLVVTGPWLDYQGKPKLPSRFTGTLSRTDLNGILAASDIGLAPIFEGSGTLLKVLEYMSAGLPVVATPVSQAGIPRNWLAKSRIYLGKDWADFASRLRQAITENSNSERVPANEDLIATAYEEFSGALRGVIEETVSE
jgi:glycosyltransferase involved in cell wall biosynthesis